MQVLVLEDDPSLRLAVHDVLQDEGHDVLTAGSQKEALHQLRQHMPDLLIFDLLIHGKHCVSTIKAASVLAPYADVIIMTGSTMFPHGELFQKFDNISWTLRKPVELKDLTNLVAYAAHRRSMLDEPFGSSLE